MPKSHNLNKSILDTFGKVVGAQMSRGDKPLLLVEGAPDCTFYGKFVFSLKKNMTVLPVGKGNYLSIDDKIAIGGIIGNVSAKLAIILILKRINSRESVANIEAWKKRKIYGIIDKDYFLEKDIESVEKKFKDYLDSKLKKMSVEDWGVLFYNVLKEKRIIATDTNDVETLIFKFDRNAVVQSNPNSISPTAWNSYMESAEEKSRRLGFIRRKSEDNANERYATGKKIPYLEINDFIRRNKWKITPSPYNQYALAPSAGLKDIDTLLSLYSSHVNLININEWKECIPSSYINDLSKIKGHDLVNILLELANQNNICFATEKDLITEILNHVTVSNFKKTSVYKFIKKI